MRRSTRLLSALMMSLAVPAVSPSASAARAPTHRLPTKSDPSVVSAHLTKDSARSAPLADGATFIPGDTVFAVFTLIGMGDQHVQLIWKHDGVAKAHVPLPIGRGKTWRTYAQAKLHRHDVGAWTAELARLDGTVLHTLAFTVISRSEAKRAPAQP